MTVLGTYCSFHSVILKLHFRFEKMYSLFLDLEKMMPRKEEYTLSET